MSKASGVFLWVDLVVASLKAGMEFGDRIADLRTRLEQLPPDLRDLYEKLLRSLNPFYLPHATQLWMIIQAAKQPLSLILLSFADEETFEYVQEIYSCETGPIE